MGATRDVERRNGKIHAVLQFFPIKRHGSLQEPVHRVETACWQHSRCRRQWVSRRASSNEIVAGSLMDPRGGPGQPFSRHPNGDHSRWELGVPSSWQTAQRSLARRLMWRTVSLLRTN